MAKKKSSVKANKNGKASIRISASLGKAQYGGENAPVVIFTDSGDGDGSMKFEIKMKCYPDGAGGWICN